MSMSMSKKETEGEGRARLSEGRRLFEDLRQTKVDQNIAQTGEY